MPHASSSLLALTCLSTLTLGPQAPDAAATAPAWVRALWGSALEAAQAEARASRKPLLVLVVPSDIAAARTRGEFLAEVLEAADEEFLIDLACCEVVCAPASELHRLTLELLLPADPLAVLFIYGDNAFAARSVHVAPYSDLARVGVSDGVVFDCEQACQRALQHLIRAAGSREALAAEQRGGRAEQADGMLAGVRAGASLPAWLADRWAPLLAEFAAGKEIQAGFVRERLLAVARRELLEEPPRGSA
ncbi:MAG: hypothetical protein FJ299_03345, partial [Planctomycetes bacterium]|nr:hypothetical protein [Planctomycetota bacterium]